MNANTDGETAILAGYATEPASDAQYVEEMIFEMGADYYDDSDYVDHVNWPQISMPQPPGEPFEWKADRLTTWGSQLEREMYEQARDLGKALDAWCMWQLAHKLEVRPLHHVQQSTLEFIDDLIGAIDEQRPQRSHVIEENEKGRLLTVSLNPNSGGSGAAA